MGTKTFDHFIKLKNNCDPQDPLLSSTILGHHLERIQLIHVYPRDLVQLTQALNLEQLIPSEKGIARDYRGLAELMGFNLAQINAFKRSLNPTMKLIDAFCISKNLINSTEKQASVNDLIRLIEKIERFDVIDDFLPILIRLANNHVNSSRVIRHFDSNYTNPIVEFPSSSKDSDFVGNSTTINDLEQIDRLTIDDTQHSKALYDAFVCYAPEDINYAQELISLLECQGKRIVTADDPLPGNFENDSLIQLIETRCRKVIIILTPNFSRSKDCKFQTKLASELAVKNNTPAKLIPVLFEPCENSSLPAIIRVMSKIDMTDRKSQLWQLKKLLRSLDFGQEVTYVSQLRSISYDDRSNSTSPTDDTRGIYAPTLVTLNERSQSNQERSSDNLSCSPSSTPDITASTSSITRPLLSDKVQPRSWASRLFRPTSNQK